MEIECRALQIFVSTFSGKTTRLCLVFTLKILGSNHTQDDVLFMKYRKEIDGLRSIAVLPVIFFHAGISVFSGGYIGVDVFFVISGYLITSIIITEIDSKKFTIREFYERRARRILPALFFVIATCIPFAWAWMTPTQLEDFSQSLIAVSMFSSNLLFWTESGYFSPNAELKPLLHTWSLAVEEQYYIFFPVFILATWRFGKRFVFLALLAIGAGSLLLSQWGASNHPNANFYLLPTRLWELLAGSLLALYLLMNQVGSRDKSAVIDQTFSVVGLALIFYSIFYFGEQTPFPSLYSLVPVVGTALIILYASPNTAAARFLSNKVLVSIGLISYSAYLWHQPLFAFARLRIVDEPSWLVMLALGGLSLALAFFSWRFIERPFRSRSRISKARVFSFACIASTLIAGLGAVGHVARGFPSRTIATGESYEEVRLDERAYINYGLSSLCGEAYTLSESCRTDDHPEILVWGDSYAMHLVLGIVASNPNSKIIQFTKSVCGPILGLAPQSRKYPESWSKECLVFNDSVATWIQSNDSPRYAVLSSPFHQYFNDEVVLRTTLGTSKRDDALVEKSFLDTLDFLASEGVTPVVFSPPPSLGKDVDIGACLQRAYIFGEALSRCDFSQLDSFAQKERVISLLENVSQQYRVIWLDDFLCFDNSCTTAIEGTFLYRDSGHLSREGAALIGSKVNFYQLITSHDSQ